VGELLLRSNLLFVNIRCAVVALLAVMSGLNAGCQTLDPAANPQKGPPSSVEQGHTPLDESFD
jgi:hypothetical protein